MNEFIKDPTNPERAIHAPTGKMAGQLYFGPALDHQPTLADIANMAFIGFTAPNAIGITQEEL